MVRNLKSPIRLVVVCALLLTALWAQVYNLSLGKRTLYSLPNSSLALTEAIPLRVGLRSARYLRAVGGVTFESTAAPAIPLSRLDLKYDRAKPDGQRFWVMVNDRPSIAPIYDWQLLPIARFADSEHTACFSLFTPKEEVSTNPELAALAERNPGGRIIRFHPAFKNTLVGLRLMQLDMLIISDDSVLLPQAGANGYVLGRGESTPNIDAGKAAFERVNQVIEGATEKGQKPFDSYVIHDQESTPRIRFTAGPSASFLVLSGDPAFHTFVYPEDEGGAVQPTRWFSRWLAENRSTVRAINPAVWDTSINVLRYAAFFRYCKKQFPAQWQNFLSDISRVAPEPQVYTPDFIDDPDVGERLRQLEKLREMFEDRRRNRPRIPE